MTMTASGRRTPQPTAGVGAEPLRGVERGSYGELDKVLGNLEVEYLQCRDFGHSWRPFSAVWVKAMSHYQQIFQCGRCHTERIRYIGVRGQNLGSSYNYADGYQLKGLGRLTGEDRDHVRMASLKTVLVKDTVEE